MKKSAHQMIDKEDAEKKELDDLNQAIINNPMLYPLVDDYYLREQTNRGKIRLRCKQSQICFNQEIIRNVVRFRCSSRFYEKCQAYFSTDLKIVFILNEKLEHTCSQDKIYRQEKTKTRIEIEKAVLSFKKKLQQKQSIPYQDHSKFFKPGENFILSDYPSSEGQYENRKSSSTSSVAPEDHCEECKQKAIETTLKSHEYLSSSSSEEEDDDEDYVVDESLKIKPMMIGKKRQAATTSMLLEERVKNPVAGDAISIEKPIQQKDNVGAALVLESKSLLNLIEETMNRQQAPQQLQGLQPMVLQNEVQSIEAASSVLEQQRSKVIFKVTVEGCEFVIKGAEWSVKQL